MKLRKIGFVLVLIFFMCVLPVLAAEPELTIKGDDTAKPSETKTLTVKIHSTEDIGVVSGTIEKNENITKIELSGQNGWNLLAYNEDNGKFELLKAAGAKDENVLEIRYTTSNNEGTATIKMKDLKVSTITYEEKTLNEITKTITIKNESAQTGTKQNQQKPKKDDTQAKNRIPQTGLENYLGIVVLLVITMSVSYILYKKYN